ncbi:MAG: amidophosphoribosyltransferase [Saprospiraceae bacterium]|nr:amidophosphoribosyltransferase [Saprospiraceae bacterium]
MESKYELQDTPIDKMTHECGVFGVWSPKPDSIFAFVYYGLYALQHRGQESSGISITLPEGRIVSKKGMGVVSDVFDELSMVKIVGKSAIGHVRYSTFGSSNVENAQPLEISSKYGQIALAHNGNLSNARLLKEALKDKGSIFQTNIDSEVILHLLTRSDTRHVENALHDALSQIEGGYALVVMTGDKLIGIRDPDGIRPLCMGKTDDGKYVLSSESCGLDAVGAEFIRDIEPGEMVRISEKGVTSKKFTEDTKKLPCSFEYIYFARPDSTMDGVDVYKVRHKSGQLLYDQHKVEADVVIGVPDSGTPAAIGFSEASGIPYGMGLIKNKYIGRTFIKPSQELRERAVGVKLNPLKPILEGKRVVVIDDSIVRGTTSRRLVTMLKEAGAKEVHFRVASPPVKWPCFLGIDTPTKNELIANHMSPKELGEWMGADSLEYLSIENLRTSLAGENYCFGCLTGAYPVKSPEELETAASCRLV